MPYQVLVVDDQMMPRQLFASFLEKSDDYVLADMLSSAQLAVDYCARHPVDLVLMDIVMRNGINGLDASKEIKRIRPKTKIIVVTSMPEVSFIDRAKEIGVESFWYKEVQQQPILDVINRTMAGESVYPDATPVRMLGNVASNELTGAELLVLREITTGATNREIAERLFISVATVRTHVQHMLQKTGYKNRVELAVKARLEGIVIGD